MGGPRLGDFPVLCRDAGERLERLTRYMEHGPLQTETGNRLFKKKLEGQIPFMKGLLEDGSLTVFPWQ